MIRTAMLDNYKQAFVALMSEDDKHTVTWSELGIGKLHPSVWTALGEGTPNTNKYFNFCDGV